MLLTREEQEKLRWCCHNCELINGETKNVHTENAYGQTTSKWKSWGLYRNRVFVQWVEDYYKRKEYFLVRVGRIYDHVGWFRTTKRTKWTVVSDEDITDGPWWDFLREELPKMEEEIKKVVNPPPVTGDSGSLSLVEKKV